MGAATTPSELISIADACVMTTLGRTAIWKLIKDGDFPKPFLITGRRKALVKSEVEDWIAGRIARRSGDAAA